MTPICLDSLDLRYHLVSQCADKLNPRISEHWEQNTVPPTTFPTFPQMRDSRQVLRHFRGFQRLRNLRVRSVAQDSKVRILSSDGSYISKTSPSCHHLQISGTKKPHIFSNLFTLEVADTKEQLLEVQFGGWSSESVAWGGFWQAWQLLPDGRFRGKLRS